MSPYLAIVKSRFNEFITNELTKGAIDEFGRLGFTKDQIEVIEVPGAFEIPATVSALLRHRQFKAIVCIGAIIRGETSHFEHVAAGCTNGISELAQRAAIPISFGVLTVENADQALARCGIKGPNHGAMAARTAVDMINVFKSIKKNSNPESARPSGASVNSNP